MYYTESHLIKLDLQECLERELSPETLKNIEFHTARLKFALDLEEKFKQDNVHPRVVELLKLPQYPQRSPKWFEQRQLKLTSSDIDTVLGHNKYAKPEEVLFKKNGVRKPFTGNHATRHGEKYEDEAIRLYCERYDKKTFSFGLIPHPTISFLAGSPDDITYDGIVVEVKCPLRRKIVLGEIPEHYQSQIRMNMEIADLDRGVFIEYQPCEVFGTEVLNVVHIDRDPEWFKNVFPKLEEFWNDVLRYQGCIETHPNYQKYLESCKVKFVPSNNSTAVCYCGSRPFKKATTLDKENVLVQ